MFKLEIKTDNAAFAEDWQSEVSRLLRAVADRLDRDDGRNDRLNGACCDVNGNIVGFWGKEAD